MKSFALLNYMLSMLLFGIMKVVWGLFVCVGVLVVLDLGGFYVGLLVFVGLFGFFCIFFPSPESVLTCRNVKINKIE